MKIRTTTTWKEQNSLMYMSVAYISGNSGRRAFDAVVIEIRKLGLPWSQAPHTIVLRTSGMWHMEIDMARCQRLCRRLKAIGVKFNTTLGYCGNTGIRGTLFAHFG